MNKFSIRSLCTLLAALGLTLNSTHVSADSITEYPIPTSASGPSFIAADGGGFLWFTESTQDKIGKIDEATGLVTEYSLSNSGSKPYGITKGPDGNMWFTEFEGDRIGKITANGTITEYALQTGAEPYQITSDEANGVLWFSLYGLNEIAKITTAGVVTTIPTPSVLSHPTGLTVVNGEVWFCEEAANKIARLLADQTFLEYPIATAGALPNGIFFNSRGIFWFTMPGADKVATIDNGGTITEYPVPTAASMPIEIIEGPLGTGMWTTESVADKIGKFGFSGTAIGTVAIPTSSSTPFGITLGSDNNLWFTEQNGGKIAKIIPDNFLAITTDSALPSTTTGSSYSAALSATGGSTPYTYTLLNGNGFSFPPGFSLSSDGRITGTTDTPGIYIVRVGVSDAAGISVLKGFSLSVTTGPLPDLKPVIHLSKRSSTKDTFIVRISNLGDASSQSAVFKAYASRNSTIDKGDTLLSTKTLPPIAPGRSISESVAVRRKISGGRNKFLVCVNCINSFAEHETINNVSASRIQ